jgi:hypothetical protein
MAGGGRERTPKNLGAQVIVSRAPWMAGTSPAMTVAGPTLLARPSPKTKIRHFLSFSRKRRYTPAFPNQRRRAAGKADMDTETALKPDNT